MKKVSIVIAIALASSLILSSTAFAGLFCNHRCARVCCFERVLVDCEYTVQIPVFEERQGTYQVCRWVPVTREIEVRVDRGYWEEYEVVVPVRPRHHRGLFGLGLFRVHHHGHHHHHHHRHPCAPACNPCAPVECFQVITCRRWVPNFVTETRTITVCERVFEERTFTYQKFVGWEEEVRIGQRWMLVPRPPVCLPCGPAVYCGC